MEDGDLKCEALCREFQEEIRHLFLETNRLSEAIRDEQAKKKPAIRRWRDVRDRNTPQVQERLAALIEASRASASVRDSFGDVAVRVENLWETTARSLDELAASLDGDTPDAKATARLDALTADLVELLTECGYCTIPQRLSQNLEVIRVGGAIDFHAEFADEVPSETARQQIFDWLYRHPAAFDGVIDKARGLVIKAAPSRRTRALLLLALLVLAAMAVASPFLRNTFGIKDTLIPSIANDAAISRAILWAFFGGFLHVLIDVFKDVQRSRQSGVEAPTIGDWALWIHVRTASIAVAIAAIWIAALAAVHMTKMTDVVTMLAVGYSADSIIDTLQPKAVSLFTKRTESVTKLIG